MGLIQKERDAVDGARRALVRWAIWAKSIKIGNLNYPNKTNFVQVPSGTSELVDPLAEQVEAILCKLDRKNPLIVEALRIEYWTDYSLKQKAQEMKVSEATFKSWRCYGEHYVAGALD